ncbi:1-acyl-sn-glycerol-3-phosphate acyltransferase [Kocuria tytonicola]|uniref:1-acyl-sn-glycerol-3-phosphate acyltransferase n=1 Tax=Kocuria tytonicola TaxID=2055946 RepID=A0A3L9L817_9MICC|nr:lysophospholipid acyltransferase family protein [Kocuria tytonicola]RLY94711.1 1-acyl-sn-glycerol-3-phosphate acyltransferase [Kocuria tytonicola]
MSRTSQRSTFRVLAAGIVPVYRSLAVPHWRGTENFPAAGGFVVAANHLTELDPIVVAHAVYRAGIMPRFLAKESLFRIPVVGRLLSRIGQVPVYRGTSRAKDSLDAAFTELDSGGAIIVYPEGTITRDPRMWPMRGRTGAARLALQAGVPVVPVAHWGDQEILYRDPEGHRTAHPFPPKRVHGVVGTPLHAEDLVPGGLAHPGHPTANELAHATTVIMAAVAELLGELRGEPAPRDLMDPRADRAASSSGGAAAATAGAASEDDAARAPGETDPGDEPSSAGGSVAP